MREIIIAAIFILLSVSAQSENFSGIKNAIEEAVITYWPQPIKTVIY